MPTLAEMLAAKKAQASQPIPSPQPSPQSPEASSNGNSQTGIGIAADAGDAKAGGQNVVESTDNATQSDGVQTVAAPTQSRAPAVGLTGGLRLGGLKLGSLTLGGSANGNAGGSDGGVAGPNQSAPTPPASDGASTDRVVDSSSAKESAAPVGLGLAAIAGLGAGVPEPTQLIGEDDLNDGVDGLDLVDCVAPDRELPAEMADQMLSFIKSLDSIFQLAADPEMFVDMVRKTQREMQEHPALGKLLCDADVRIAIRGMRQSAGLAQVKKQAVKEKRGKSAKANTAAVASAMDSLLSLANSTAFD